MAKVEGTQSIPAEWLDEYRAALTEKQPDGVIRKRYPYRVPKMQSNKGRPHAAQIAQRNRFKTAIDRFKGISTVERGRWYDSMPAWGSFLWYYNWFMLSALNDVLGVVSGGMSVIKEIINTNFSCPTGGTAFSFSPAVDPDKVVILMHGAAVFTTVREEESYAVAFGYPIYPVWDSLGSQSISVGWAMTPVLAANVAIQIVEYI